MWSGSVSGSQLFLLPHTLQDLLHRYRIDHDECREFTAGEDIIADRYLARHERLPDPLVDTLVMAAEEYQIPLQRQLIGHPLIEPLAIRTHIHNLIVCPIHFQPLDAGKHRFRF